MTQSGQLVRMEYLPDGQSVQEEALVCQEASPALSTMCLPAAQGSHEEAEPVENFPAAQIKQEEDPVEEAYVPAAQSGHDPTAPVAYFPAAQLEQSAEESWDVGNVEDTYLPSGQFVQLVEAALAVNLPLGHTLQDVEPADSWNLPTLQLEQAPVPVAEAYLPATQLVQDVEPAAEDLPLAQFVQSSTLSCLPASDAASLLYFPAAQSVHEKAEPVEYLPAAQMLGRLELQVSSTYLPAGAG
jgi:hypothetical protein